MPLYQQIVQDIAARIECGEWQAGDKLPSERDLCKAYGVSQITVRRALRELATLGRVFSRHGLGWFIDDRSLMPVGPAEVLMLLPNLCWPLNRLATDILQRLRQAGKAVRLIFEAADSDAATEILHIAARENVRVALVAIAGREQALRARYAQMDADLSLLFLLRAIPRVSIPAAVLDERGAMRTMTQHLLGLGHRRIAYVGGDPVTIEGWERYQGFRDALWSQGLELPLDWAFAESPTQGAEAKRFKAMLSSPLRPTAIACTSDDRAAEVLQALHEAGYRCPKDVAVVGLGDSDLAGRLWPPLTTFHFDLDALAQAVSEMTCDLTAGRPVKSACALGNVVIRQSCGAAR